MEFIGLLIGKFIVKGSYYLTGKGKNNQINNLGKKYKELQKTERHNPHKIRN